MTLHYAQNVKNGGYGIAAPEGFTSKQWHQDAIADTGTSHTRPGRLYIIQCEWCDEAFAANTAGESESMFLKHEEEMLDSTQGFIERKGGRDA